MTVIFPHSHVHFYESALLDIVFSLHCVIVLERFFNLKANLTGI